ncbi:IclR family transcriptional regulator [Epibacterium ulvae]|uniref:Transcriptional regulator, IclR family n=1 Tax=Epibacterium ulvae TaxID=1156985 RepID=A0A1G5PMW5_9RHOB|nr:IclR family transcriptional regulator C-terminal domain-containing protein [Epibacterium ulvae]SCZ50832.1 transcriptional regulator, IclR family [Epibacterium ulvae]
MSKTSSQRSISSSFIKGLAILEAFDAETSSLTLAELARRTGQDRATARRGALTLVAAGYLRQVNRKLRLSPRVLGLAGNFLSTYQFNSQIQPILDRYAHSMTSEISLVILDGDAPLTLAHSRPSRHAGDHIGTLGTQTSLWHSSFGRMLLALRTQEDVASALETRERTKPTHSSIVDPLILLEKINEARLRGFVFVDGEEEQGIASYAVPVSIAGQTPLVVGTSFPRGLGKSTLDEVVLAHLQACAAEIRHTSICAALS